MATEVELAKQQNRPNVVSFSTKMAEPSYFEVRAVNATNLLEVFSVSIRRDTQELNDVGSSFQISGYIKLTNDYEKEFFLFKRKDHDPETVSMLDNRTAILPKSSDYCPRWLPKYFWLEVDLEDRSRNVTIVKDKIMLDFQDKVPYDKEQTQTFDSEGYGCVTLKYTIFRAALLVFPALQVSKIGRGIENSGTDECDVSVNGSISATTEVKGEKGLSRVLCDMQSMSLTMDELFWLPALAAPAYSLLKIKAKLEVNGEQIVTSDGVWEFEPDSHPVLYRKEIVGEKWRISLIMYWAHPYLHLDTDEFVGELLSCDIYKASQEKFLVPPTSPLSGEEAGDTLISSINQESEDWYLLGCLWGDEDRNMDETRVMSSVPTDFARPLVEVFSVYVGSFSDEHPFLVYGTINYQDSLKGYHIFKGEGWKYNLAFPNRAISLRKPQRCIEPVDQSFGIYLDLKDDKGREISKGCLEWNFQTVLNWYDKRLCSVVTGEHGFACVHYAMFDDAVAAKVRARLYPCFDPPFAVSGSIYARYSTYRCSTNYEKSFYRIKLFEEVDYHLRRECNACLPDFAVHLQLSKDVVAVPSHTSLILEVDIRVHLRGILLETIRGELAVDPCKSTMRCAKKIKGQTAKAEFYPARILELEVRWI